MRTVPVVLLCLALVAVPLAAASASTSFPFTFLVDDCRGTLGVPGGGCSAEMSGTVEADCGAVCDFRLAGTIRGVRADSPLSTGVAAGGLVVYEVPSGSPHYNDGASASACSAADAAAEVSCDFDLSFTGAALDWGPGYGLCSFVGVDVWSSTEPAAAGVGVPVATHSARTGSDPGDSRPPAVGWEFCVEGDTMQVLDYYWW